MKPLTPVQWKARRQKRAAIVAKAGCPTCNAYAGNTCRNDRGKPRLTPHLSRRRLFFQLK